MKPLSRVIFVWSLLLVTFIAQGFAFQEKEIKKNFKGIKEIRIKTVSGNCFIEKGEKDEVTVTVTYTYDESDFEPELEQMGDRLDLTERFRGHTRSGTSTWRLTVPEETDIDFSTASGDLDVSDLKSTIEASTASGNVRLSNLAGNVEISTASGEVEVRGLQGDGEISTASGDVDLSGVAGKSEVSTASGRIRAENLQKDIKLSTASGSVDLSSSSGDFEVSTASGDLDATEIVIEMRSSFSAASGDVDVALASSPNGDVKLSSASGDAVLNFKDNPINGFVKMSARANRGRIEAPFEFDHEEVYYEGDQEYVTKTAKKGSDHPRIEISTASGKAVLRKN